MAAILNGLERIGGMASLADRARCVVLLGACVRDLSPVRYQPADPRYRKTLKVVLSIFHKENSQQVDVQVRLGAAEALGRAGDSRLHEDNWIRIEAGKFWMGAQSEDPRKPAFNP